MKILSWNCNGALRNKLDIILGEYADVYCFQESETPYKWEKIIEKDFHKPIYINDNLHKGISILIRKNVTYSQTNFKNIFYNNKYGVIKDKSIKYFLSIKVENKYTIINCWCHKNKSEHFAYKGQLWKYLISNIDNFDENTILIGDFNANKIWDDDDCWWNMSDNNKILNECTLYSAYHIKNKEELGKERIPTYFQYRHLDRPYHIDYAYVNQKIY